MIFQARNCQVFSDGSMFCCWDDALMSTVPFFQRVAWLKCSNFVFTCYLFIEWLFHRQSQRFCGGVLERVSVFLMYPSCRWYIRHLWISLSLSIYILYIYIIYVCIYIYIYTQENNTYMPCIHAYMHTCTHAHMHTCTHAQMHTWIHAYRHTGIQAYTHARTHARRQAGRQPDRQTDRHTYIYIDR